MFGVERHGSIRLFKTGSPNGVVRNYAFIASKTTLLLIFVSFVVNPTAGFRLIGVVASAKLVADGERAQPVVAV